MNGIWTIGLLTASLILAGCATGKSIKDADDIADDGERNVVLLTSDIKLYVNDRHSSAKRVKLTFRCPQGGSKLGRTCFGVTSPYLGIKTVDGFGVHAFESSGAKAIKMKYGQYVIQSASYSIVVDRIPEVSCYISKKTKKNVCSTTMRDKTERYRASFPQPIAVNVSPGTGCYLGHLQLSMINNEITEFDFDSNAQLSAERLANVSVDVADALNGFVDRPCSLNAVVPVNTVIAN